MRFERLRDPPPCRALQKGTLVLKEMLKIDGAGTGSASAQEEANSSACGNEQQKRRRSSKKLGAQVMTALPSVFLPSGSEPHSFLSPPSSLRPRSSEHERPPWRGAWPPLQPQRRCRQQQSVGAGAALRRLRNGPARLQHYWQTTGNGVYCVYCCGCSHTSSISPPVFGSFPPYVLLRSAASSSLL